MGGALNLAVRLLPKQSLFSGDFGVKRKTNNRVMSNGWFANRRFSQLSDERCWHVREHSPSMGCIGHGRFGPGGETHTHTHTHTPLRAHSHTEEHTGTRTHTHTHRKLHTNVAPTI